ncbi:AAA family ATPase [Pseudomonas citronellolis]|uniref:ATP-dependent nuclease n=1 Tax=Pseudomonas citronellolis TaxID=53408 RepID=UPI002270871A|nr:AAA family ATPase [Pseudomonas citronellolis]WAB90172.1 AAA family ATPase [Pseudomonas citronellolis]
MRITKITIQNFRSIQHAEFTPSVFNVFAGQNNHGKTNFFEAIEWFYTGSGDLGQIAYRRDRANEVSVEIEYSGILAGIDAVKNEGTRTKFSNFADGRDVLRVIRTSREPSKRLLWDEGKGEWTAKNFAGFDKAFNDCVPRLQYVATRARLSDVSKWGKKTPIGEMLSGVLNAILETSAPYRDFKAKFDELFTGEGSEVKQELDKLAGKVKEYLEQQFPECTKIGFGVTPPIFDDLLKSFETAVDDGIETLAEEKGDGMQRALMLAILKTYSDHRRDADELGKRFLFLIDEAELHLHPTAQRQLKLALLQLAKNGDQVFINTHSSVLVADDIEGQAIWRIAKNLGATTINEVGAEDKPDLVFELLGGSPADLLFPKNFLVVEGASEDHFLSRVLQRFYRDQPWVKVIRAEGDHEMQRRSMHALNVAFTPLYQTPVYATRFVVLCDKPHADRQRDFEQFLNAYDALSQSGQIIVSPFGALEECYPVPWRKTADEVRAMTSKDKTALATEVGLNISKVEFEQEMPHIFKAFEAAWARAHR